MIQTEEQRLIDGCRRLDRRAQERLFGLYHNYVLSIASRYADSEAQARDILQDAFVKMFRQLDQYNDQSAFKWWLRRIVINTAIDYWRSRMLALSKSDIVSNESMYAGVEPEALDQLNTEDILKLVQQLPASYRIVFSLHVVEGFTHEEIAERLGITVGSSKSNLFKAKARLQVWIKEYSL